MFNSGMMLINLDKWRQGKVEEKLLSFISRKKMDGYSMEIKAH